MAKARAGAMGEGMLLGTVGDMTGGKPQESGQWGFATRRWAFGGGVA